jgi:1-acyl-sn-glycerol-3-phosphate acyltransferase
VIKLEANVSNDKPRAEISRPDLTRLPTHNPWRRFFRFIVKIICRILVLVFFRCEVRGLENFPQKGGAVVAVNHLGDADSVLGMAFFPRMVDAVAKVELYFFPVLGWFMDTYGVIWVHRGTADRKAIKISIEGLRKGRLIGVAPEGRESVSGELEEGTGGAAYIALKSGVPVVPVTFTGTENKQVFANLKRFRRTSVSMTVGRQFNLVEMKDRREAIKAGTQKIMLALAKQLPPEYRGVYREQIG